MRRGTLVGKSCCNGECACRGIKNWIRVKGSGEQFFRLQDQAIDDGNVFDRTDVADINAVAIAVQGQLERVLEGGAQQQAVLPVGVATMRPSAT